MLFAHTRSRCHSTWCLTKPMHKQAETLLGVGVAIALAAVLSWSFFGAVDHLSHLSEAEPVGCRLTALTVRRDSAFYEVVCVGRKLDISAQR